MRADDRAARDAGQHFDFAQDIQFREPCKHANMEERRAETSSRKAQTDLPGESAAHGGGIAEKLLQRRPRLRILKILALQPRIALKCCQRGELPNCGFKLP